MLDRILAAFSRGGSQELEDSTPLWRIPEPELALMSDPVMAGRLWEPGECIDGLYEVLERGCGRIGPLYRLRHLVWGTELRARSPLLVYVSDPRARAALTEAAGLHAQMGLHPNLVATLGARTVEDVPRILSEVARGETLRERMPIDDLTRVLDYGIQICHGLDFAHQHNLAHHDLTLETVRVDRGGTVRIDQFFPARSWADLRDLDARLSKDRSLPEDVRKALEGSVPATPLSVPPERWQRAGTPVSKAGNLYSLGVMLFQMATGRPPFLPYERHGASVVASLKARVLAEEAPDARKFKPELPEALAAVLAACLQRDPAKRPESPGAVADVLEGLFREATGRPSPRPRFPTTRFVAENLNNAALLALDRGREEEARARLDEALQAGPDLPEAQTNRALLGWIAGEIPMPHVQEPRAEAWLLVQAGESRRALELLDRLEEGGPSAWLQNLRGILLMEEGSPRQALTSFERAAAGEPARWEFHHNLGICLSRSGEKEKALPHLQKAVALAGHPTARISLALALAAEGKVGEAKAQLDAAWEREPDSAWIRYHLGVYHASMGLRVPGFDSAPTDLDEAERHLEAAVSRAAGFYRARDALTECRRRAGRPVPMPGLWELPPSAPELRELGALWTVRLSRVLSGHQEAVNALTMSWDGRYIVSAGHDDSILVWDPLRGEVKSRLRGHAGAVRAVSVSADGNTLASGSDDGTARLWSLPSGPTMHLLRGHQGPVTATALSPAGAVLLTGGDDRTVRVWEARTGDLRHVLEGHDSRVTAVAVSYDGALGVSASVDRRVIVWELVTGGVLADLDLEEEVYGIALSSDSRYLLTGGGAKVLRLWDLDTGECMRELVGHENEVRTVSLSPDGRYALSGGWDRTVRLWNLATGECIRTMSDHDHQITAVHAAADGRFGLSGSLDRALRLWEWKEELLPLAPGKPPLQPSSADRAYRDESARMLAAGVLEEARTALAAGDRATALGLLRRVQALPGRARDAEIQDLVREATRDLPRTGVRDGWELHCLEGHQQWVLRVEWSPDGAFLASGGLDGPVYVWDLHEGGGFALEGHGREISALAFAPGSARLLSGSYDRTLRVWDLDAGTEVAVLRGHLAEVTAGVVSGSRPVALSASMDGVARLWSLETAQPVRDFKGHEGVVFSVALAPEDALVATGGADRRIVLWSMPDLEQVRELKGHTGPVTSLVFRGDVLLSGSDDRRAILWDVATGQERVRLQGHEAAVRCVDLSEDARFALTASDDGTLRVWSCADGAELLRLEGHEGPARWARFSPDGSFVASAGNDRSVRVWALDWDV